MSNKISDMMPEAGAKVTLAIEKMKNDAVLKKEGVTGIFINETLRSLAVQMAYYSRSRMAVADVKKMYSAAGLYRIGDEEAKKAVTWTLASNHIQGLAADLVPEINGIISWNAPAAVWQRMGEIGGECGLTWGGKWTQPDNPHFEYTK
jgi:hypothetical protein